MNKPLFTAIYILSLLTAGLTIHQAFAQQRRPAIEPITEVSIEDNRPSIKGGGFDFSDKSVSVVSSNRMPANISTKSPSQNTPYSYIGPMIFLFALPFALWIMISKKINNSNVAEKNDYSQKTFQFNAHKDKKEAIDDNKDHHQPKAS